MTTALPIDKVHPYPTKPVILPTNLLWVQNGTYDTLDTTKFTQVNFPLIGIDPLQVNAARCWNMMAAMFTVENPGHQLTCTSLADVYRTCAQQEIGFFIRYSPTYNPIKTTLKTKKYNGKTYWLRRGFADIAVPCTNGKHGFGLAVDVQYVGPDGKLHALYGMNRAWDWLLRNADAYGWCWESTETWHLNFYPGDVIPPWVLQLEAFFAAVTPKT